MLMLENVDLCQHIPLEEVNMLPVCRCMLAGLSQCMKCIACICMDWEWGSLSNRVAYPESEGRRLWRVLCPVLEHAMNGLRLGVQQVSVGQVPSVERLQNLCDLWRGDKVQATHRCAWRIGCALKHFLHMPDSRHLLKRHLVYIPLGADQDTSAFCKVLRDLTQASNDGDTEAHGHRKEGRLRDQVLHSGTRQLKLVPFDICDLCPVTRAVR